jgi:hypothetical protein
MGIGGSQKGVLRPARGLLILPFKGVDLFGKASVSAGAFSILQPAERSDAFVAWESRLRADE